MDRVKIAGAFASSILITLVLLLVFTKKPEKELYDAAVETVMAHEDLTSVEEAKDHCPELKNIQQQMERIARLNSSIHSLTGGPAPSVSENQSEEIMATTNEIKELRMDVKKKLIKLMDTYKQNQPSEIVRVEF